MSPHADAAVHIEDRGYQFADGVYEVCEVARGHIMDMTRHLDRLDRSLGELQIAWPMARKALQIVMREVVRRNRVDQRPGLSAGDARRGEPRPCLSRPRHQAGAGGHRQAQSILPPRAKRAESGIKVITVPENRWDRVDIKTVGLLPNVLAKQKAKVAGAQEAWFVDPDGTVKEGAVDQCLDRHQGRHAGHPPAEHGILRGITRTTLFDVAAKLGSRSRSAASRSPKPRRRAKPSSPRPRPSSCRSWRSTAIRSPTAIRARSHFRCGSAFFDVAEKT